MLIGCNQAKLYIQGNKKWKNTCTPNIKSSYTYEDLLASGRGELFGKEGPQLPAPTMLMMDRIVKMTEDGGVFGKGILKRN